MTNGEKIKRMNYWQLVNFMHKTRYICSYNECSAHQPGCALRCKQRWLEWMKEEVEEDV